MKSVITLFLLLCYSISYSQSVKISWDANQEPDLAGYKVYIGESSRDYGGNVDVKKETTFVWSSFELGKTYYFAVTAYDSSDNESEYSDEVSVILSGAPDTTPPDPPNNIRIEIIEEELGILNGAPIILDMTPVELPEPIWIAENEVHYYDDYCDCIRMFQRHSDATKN